jgi:gamma-glutamyltranspeptidase / glutathione hydrolase
VLSVVHPHACGLGGDAMVLVGDGDATIAINGNGTAPAGILGTVPVDGGGTCAVPGFVAGLASAHARFGRRGWRELIGPALALASEGFVVGDELAGALRRQLHRLSRTSGGWPLLAPGLGVGSVVRLTDLAATLTEIAEAGPEAFYAGAIATAIADAVRADGGTMTLEDLAGYAPAVASPAVTSVSDVSVEVSPPTSQGILLLVALDHLSRQLDAGACTAARVRAELEAIELAFSHRSAVALDDAVARLLSPELSAVDPPALAGGRPRAYNHTAAITAADGEGQVVSALVSLFDDFGSATFVPGCDFHLNSRLLGFDAHGPNSPAPRRRPIHTLAPALVRTPERLIGIATPGADGQIQVLLQVLVEVLMEGVPIQEALHHARWRIVGDEVVVEQGFADDIVAQMRQDGRTVRALGAGDQLFGAVSAVTAPLDGGALEAMSDPRRESWAAVA